MTYFAHTWPLTDGEPGRRYGGGVTVTSNFGKTAINRNRINSGNFGYQVNSDSDLVCFTFNY